MDGSRNLFYLVAAASTQYLLIRRGPDWMGAIWPLVGLLVTGYLLMQGRALTDPDTLAFAALTVGTLIMWLALRRRSFPYGRG